MAADASGEFLDAFSKFMIFSLQEKDVVVVNLSTGYGKSLCYALVSLKGLCNNYRPGMGEGGWKTQLLNLKTKRIN